MKFENPVHEETHQKLGEYLPELFEDPFYDADTGHFYASYGSTVLEISNDPYGEAEAVVTIMAYCVQGADADEELLTGLLDMNHYQALGAFSQVENDIFFSYSLLGRTLDRRNLLRAVEAVATIADDIDDRIVAKYGGQTALDRIRDTGGRQRRRERTSEYEAYRPREEDEVEDIDLDLDEPTN